MRLIRKDLFGRPRREDKREQRWLVFLRRHPTTPVKVMGEIMMADGMLMFRRLDERGHLVAVIGWPQDAVEQFETATSEWNPWMPEWDKS
jgi:hypothetical protein